jgi:putative FmdB family regulatory protein
MPIFEYRCRDCNQRFESLVYGSQKPECPQCGSRKLETQLSVFAVSSKSSASAQPAGVPCSTCGDPRGAGACSLPDLD